MVNRRYTGISDGKGKIQSKKPATESMVAKLSYFFGMRKVGTIGDNVNSVHSTGRAFDIRAWDFSTNNWAKSNFEEKNWNLMNYLWMYRDVLGVEEIHDYVGLYVWGTMTKYDGTGRGSDSYYGAAYRCSRDSIQEPHAPTGWKRWDLEAHSSHGGDSVGLKHIHVEMSPASVSNVTQLNAMLDLTLSNYFKFYWHSVVLAGSGPAAYVQATKMKKVVNISKRMNTQAVSDTLATPNYKYLSAIRTASYNKTFATGSFTTSIAHGFTAGQTVAITDITPSSYNYRGVITGITSATSFYILYLNGNPKSALAQGSTTFTAAGTSVTEAATYTGKTQSATNGSGSGAVFTITKTGSGTVYSGFTTVTVTSGGSNYQVGNTITIPGASLGGTTPANNLTLTVATKADGLYQSGGKVTLVGATPNYGATPSYIYDGVTPSYGTTSTYIYDGATPSYMYIGSMQKYG